VLDADDDQVFASRRAELKREQSAGGTLRHDPLGRTSEFAGDSRRLATRLSRARGPTRGERAAVIVLKGADTVIAAPGRAEP